MNPKNMHDIKIPDPKELEKEISEFLSKKFGGEVKIISQSELPQENRTDDGKKAAPESKGVRFDLKPRDLIDYLDRYIVRQDQAKAILATKICTHFNRIKHTTETGAHGDSHGDPHDDPMVGRIKNNILMIGPTGVGKTYMIKLIARKIGVPFVKGDATKFSETGYVGGDVEDLVRDLVREADNDIERAQYGIIYIDEIDKIASSRNIIGADVSRTGVQRALLKPLEETEVELKVPHDPVSMFQEIERYRKTGKRETHSVNTRNILFIVSGAFSDLTDIIRKRLRKQGIGFGADIRGQQRPDDLLRQVRSEDFIEYGFESEFVGRLPVQAVLTHLEEDDLYAILRNPNNPVILGKKLDFSAYGIDIKFEEAALRLLARNAYEENTGARGLVSAVERALLPFEKTLPSGDIKQFPVTAQVVENPESALSAYQDPTRDAEIKTTFLRITEEELAFIREYIVAEKNLSRKHRLPLTPSRVDIIADCYATGVMDMERAYKKVKALADDIKNMELYFYKSHDINIVLEDDAIDHLMSRMIASGQPVDVFCRQLSLDFEHGLKLVREKTGKNRFFITRDALMSPETYIGTLLKDASSTNNPHEDLR